MHYRLLCTALALSLAAGSAQAAHHEGDTEAAPMDHSGMTMPKGMKHHKNPINADWVETLQLDGDKAESVREIQKEFADDKRELHKEHMTKMKDLNKARDEKLKDVLSDEEMTTLETMWKAHSGMKMDHGSY